MMAPSRLWAAAIFLAAVHLAALLASRIAPYDFAAQHRDYPYAPPMKLHFTGRLVAYGLAALPDGSYAEDSREQFPIRFFTAGHLFGVDPPGYFFPLGTDAFGRDVFSRLVYGARVSLLTGLLAAALALGIGWVIGTTAGFFGGWTDQILMRMAELFSALPWLYLLLGVRAFLPLHIGPVQSFLLLIAIIGGVGWVRPARLIRGLVLSVREREFVQAASGFGASPVYLIRRHIAPETAGVLLTQATLLIPQYILAEVTLSFIGLGVGEPAPSWGNMLAEAKQYHSLVLHPWLLASGIATIPVLMGYLILADSLARVGQNLERSA